MEKLMKISKISIKNYRSCNETVFTPHGNLSVLIGPNGSGKTNVLSGIRLVSSLLNLRRRFSQKFDDSILTDASEIKTWFEIDGKSIIHTAKINSVTNERNEDEIISANESWNLFEITNSRKKIPIPLEFLNEIFSNKGNRRFGPGANGENFLKEYLVRNGVDDIAYSYLGKIVKFVEKISYYSASQFTNPSNCPLSFEVESEKESGLMRGVSIRSAHKSFLYDMYVSQKENTEAYSEFLNIVGPDGIGLVDEIEFKEIKTSSSSISVSTGGRVRKREKINQLIVPGFTISDKTLSPSQLSEGTFKTLALIFYLITDKSSMLMIEEPEVCVHHGLLKSIIELINVYSAEKQIFISTHSDTVLDSVELENIYSVSRDPSLGTVVKSISKRMSSRDLKALKEYLATEGSLGEYWKHGDLENV
jgi:AAA15 family ATPase/GTPase